MYQCRNCGAPITRSKKSRKCEYCGQPYSTKREDNLFQLPVNTIHWLGSGFGYIANLLGDSSRKTYRRIDNFFSFKSQNINRRTTNLFNRRNTKPIISILFISSCTIILSSLYIKNASQIHQKVFRSGEAIKNKIFSFDSCNSNYPTSKLISLTKPGVVRVISRNGIGSGFIVKHSNNHTFVLTNSHVVDGNSQVRVAWSDGEEDIANVVLDTGQGISPTTDLALLKIKGKEGKVLKLQKKKILIGSDIIAVGDPGGVLAYSFTKGIVSAIRDNGKAIQHDAAINPGNSGGPLISTSGCVVGVNTFKIPNSEGGNIEGVGFAISARTAHRFLGKYSFSSSDSIDMSTKSLSSKEEANEYINKARKIYNIKGRENETIKLIDKSISLFKTSEAYSILAYVNSSLGDKKASIVNYSRAIELNQDWGSTSIAFAYFNRGILNSQLKNYYLSIDDFNLAIKKDDSKADFFSSRCFSKINIRSYRSARNDCTKAIDLNQNHPYVYNYLGMVEIGLKNYSGAIRAYKKQLLIDPENKWSNNLIADAYYLMGDIKNACLHWLKASSTHSNKDVADKLTKNCYDFSTTKDNPSKSAPDSIHPLLAEELRKCIGDVSLFCKNLRRGKFKFKK